MLKKIISTSPELKTISQIFCLVLFVMLSGCESEVSSEKKHTSGEHNEFNHLDFSKLRNGDIILKQGKGSISRMIVNKLKEKIPLSHCGIVVKTADTVFIVHSVAKQLTGIDGVQKIDFRRFTGDCIKNYMYVMRCKSDSSVGNRIAASANNFLARSVPFDYDINYSDSSRVNCSEFVYWTILNATGKNRLKTITIDNKQIFAFNSLLDSAYFETVYHY